MKKLLVLIALLPQLVFAAEFRLQFDLKNRAIIYKTTDWVYIARSAEYLMFLAEPSRQEGAVYDVHTMVVFHTPAKFNYVNGLTKKIYTYGTLDCNAKTILLRNEFWVDTSENIIFDYDYSSEYSLVELADTTTIRHNVYKEVCKK